MIFQPGADDLFAVVKILRSDEADDRIDQQGLEAPRHGVGAGLAGLLVQSVMGARGQGRSLAGFKIHDVFSHGAAIQ